MAKENYMENGILVQVKELASGRFALTIGGSFVNDYDTEEKAAGVKQEIEKAIAEGAGLKTLPIWRYRFVYKDRAPKYKEYDGLCLNAPDGIEARKAFAGISGEFGLANPDNYDRQKIGLAYCFGPQNIAAMREKWGWDFADGDSLEVPGALRYAWREAVKLGEVE
jgi:hypothetical protein